MDLTTPRHISSAIWYPINFGMTMVDQFSSTQEMKGTLLGFATTLLVLHDSFYIILNLLLNNAINFVLPVTFKQYSIHLNTHVCNNMMFYL